MSRRYLLALVLAVSLITILAFFFDATGLISYGLIIASVWLMIAITVTWLIALLLSKLSRVKRRFRLRTALQLPLLSLVTGITGILVMNLYAPPAVPAPTRPPDEQLRHLYETDQGDRLALRFRNLNERDRDRLLRVRELYAQGEIITPEDHHRAAMIFQHGATSEDYEIAYQLAKKASDAGYADADGLWQSAYDRWLLSQGKPQVYGTQSRATLTIFGFSLEQD